MPSPYVYVGAAVLGLFAVVAMAFNELRQRQQNNHHRSYIRICSICGRGISENPYETACGHKFHRNCYADKLLDHRDRDGYSNMPCPSCGYSSRNTESPSERVRRRNTLRRNSDATSNSSRNDNGSSNETGRCCYCSRNLTELVGKVDKLNCGHSAHHDCRIHSQQVTQCIHCVSRGSGTPKNNIKCSNCDMPFETSDKNKKRRDCGHFVHEKCSRISQFMKCTNCPRGEEAS